MWDYLQRAGDYQKWFGQFLASRYMEFPFEVSIETMSMCNAHCEFCPYPRLDRKGAVLSDELIMKVLEECREIPSDLPLQFNFSRVNETFLDKRIYNICGWVNRELPNAAFMFFSNGSPLNESNVRRLAAIRNISKLVISLNEYRAEAYERVMGIRFDRTIENIHGLHELKERGEIAFPVEIHRVGDGSEHDRLFCAWVADHFPLFRACAGPRSDWMGAVDAPISPVPDVCCTQWFKINVLANGKVAFCCIDSEAASCIGDVASQHLLEIYNQPARRELRARTASRLHIPECANCPLLS